MRNAKSTKEFLSSVREISKQMEKYRKEQYPTDIEPLYSHEIYSRLSESERLSFIEAKVDEIVEYLNKLVRKGEHEK